MAKGSVEWIRALILDLAGHAAALGASNLPPKEEGDVDVTVLREEGETWGVSMYVWEVWRDGGLCVRIHLPMYYLSI